MITASPQDQTNEERLRALEGSALALTQSLLTLTKDLAQLREDMSAQPPEENEE